MNTYIAKMQLGEGDLIPFGTTLFGVCNTYEGAWNKEVKLDQFDKFVDGITIVVKFTKGNTATSNIKLQVGQTLPYPVKGDCTCAAGEVISFTFEEINAQEKYWHAHISGLSDNIKDYINNTINTSIETPDVLIMKGSVGTNGNPGVIPNSGYEIGWTYRVLSNGTYADWACKVGDLIIAVQNATLNQSTVNHEHWIVIQSKLNNAVMGPDYAIDNHVATFDGTSGEMIQDSGFTIGTSVPAGAIFTDTTYDAGTGLELVESNQGNIFNVLYGTTAGTAAVGNHNHNTEYASLDHEHGAINNNGTIGSATTNALLQARAGVIEIGPILDFTNSTPSKFLSNAGTWEQAILSINGVIPDTNGILELTAADLGITSSLKFIGMVASNSTYHPSDGTAPLDGQTLIISGLNSYTPTTGDIIIDSLGNREYIYDSSGHWEVLGPDGDFKVLQTAINQPSDITNRWVSSIGQNANGEISVNYQNLDTSGTWSGNAATATALETARELYVNLEVTRNQLIPVEFDGTSSIALHVSGILPIIHGGTGVGSFNKNEVVITNSPIGGAGADEFITRPYISVDRNPTLEARALISSDNFVTEATIYSGLPQINDLHNYTYESTYYSPETPGTQYQILVSGTRTESNTAIYDPQWAAAAKIESDVITTHHTNLILGNNLIAGDYSDGIITLYSAGTGSHTIQGSIATGVNYPHTLQNAEGFILQSEHSGQVGSETQPIYINSDGIATALRYVPNRLYYSTTALTGQTYAISFEATKHYADEDHIGINLNDSGAAEWPTENNQPIADVFYVKGDSTFTGVVHITSQTSATRSNGILTGALVVNGGVNINDNLFVTNHTELRSSLNVEGPVGINTIYDSLNNYILTISGSTKIVDTSINTNSAAFLDVTTATSSTGASVPTLNFYPENDATGSIGLSNGGRWKEAYFSHLLQIGDSSAGITAELTNSESLVTLLSANPSIILDTTTINVSDWIIVNNEYGIFSLNNQQASLIEFKGTDYGFQLTNRLYINPNENLSSNSNLDLYVDGYTKLYGNVGIGIDPDIPNSNNDNNDSNNNSNNIINALTINGNTAIVNDKANTVRTAAHIVLTTTNNTDTVSFYPETNATGYIGLVDNRWSKGYFSDILSIGTYANNTIITGVLLEKDGIVTIKNTHENQNSNVATRTITLDANTTGKITISSTTPTILLNTTASGGTSWIITNHANSTNTFSLNNQLSPLIELKGTDNGFALTNRLYINPSASTTTLDAQSDLDLYVNGITELYGNTGIGYTPHDNYKLNIAGNLSATQLVRFATSNNSEAAFIDLALNNSSNTINFYPNTTNTGSLGLPNTASNNSDNGRRWKTLYIGDKDTHGDEYTPIYWDNGKPHHVPVVQKYNFTFTSSTSIKISLPNTYAADAVVDSIVVTSGISYLNSEITWENINEDNTRKIKLSATINSGTNHSVIGYILVSTGYESSTNNAS